MTVPWRLKGPIDGPSSAGLEDALRRLHLAEDRAPTDQDTPPPSTFPMTKAARAALDYGAIRTVTPERRRELTHGKDTA